MQSLLRERHRAFHAVLQLAHVAGPGVVEQLLGGRRREPGHAAFLKCSAKRRMKCSASKSTSLPRARSGGMWMRITLMR